MAQANHAIRCKTTYDHANQSVVDISNYQALNNKPRVQRSAFAKVMAQMNIADGEQFAVQYEKYWQQASENTQLLSVLTCEIDFFQAYLDNYGPQATTFMQLVIALTLNNICKQYGCFIAHERAGEFIVLIKGGDEQKTQQIAQALHAAVRHANSEHKYSSVSQLVSLSIGISTVYPASMQTQLDKSRQAKARAQANGHNRICASITSHQQHNLADSATVKISTERATSEFATLMSAMSIATRGDFNAHFVKAWQHASRQHELLAMLSCELDFFAQFRARHRAQTCDDIVLLVACALQHRAEQLGVFVAHIEAGRFIALIEGGNATRGLKVAQALHQAVEQLELTHPYSAVSQQFTLSLGLASIFPSADNTMTSLMAASNNALNQAKSAGYDQIGVC